jgi:5-formyltetrahydrofolate cyclo-ligase
MQKIFEQRSAKLRRWTWVCFAAIIAGGWLGILYLSGKLDMARIDLAPFMLLQADGLVGATSSLLYSAVLAGPFSIGESYGGFDAGVMLALGLQSLLVISCLAYACYWLYRHGLPLWLSFLSAMFAAAMLPLAETALQPDASALVVACLLLLTLKLIDALRNNSYGLRKGHTILAVLILLTVLSFFHPVFFVAALPTVFVISIVPTRDKMRIFGLSLIMVVICSVTLFVVIPHLGWGSSPFSLLTGLIPKSIGFWLSASPVLMVLAVLWLIIGKVPRYSAVFVLPITIYLIIIVNPSWDQAAWFAWVLDMSLILSTPAMIFLPFMYEYDESKAGMRKRLLEIRKGIPESERAQRGLKACERLAEMVKKIDPRQGYVGLYSAFGSELSLDPLKAELGALGYRLAYPARITDSEIEFFTTIGVTDEELFNLLEEEDPFTALSVPRNTDLPHIDPEEIAVMILPCVGMDQDNNRLGYGKGCYDRYLCRLKSGTPLWVVGFSEQLVDSVPLEWQDRAADERVVA